MVAFQKKKKKPVYINTLKKKKKDVLFICKTKFFTRLRQLMNMFLPNHSYECLVELGTGRVLPFCTEV